MKKARIVIAVALAAAASLAPFALPIQAQSAPAARTQVFTATSAPRDAVDLIRLNALIAERVDAGELVVRAPQVDRLLPGRVHEYLQQVHDGVPIFGVGLARQRTATTSGDGRTISVFGTLVDGVDIDTDPSWTSAAALARMEALAGATPATDEPPLLAILPTARGGLALTWSAPMRDYRTWFLDAHTGEPVHVMNHIHHHLEIAVGFGRGITGAPQKLSTWKDDRSYLAWDRLRPGQIVTLDAKGGNFDRALALSGAVGVQWEREVARDDDNQWSNPAIVDGHAHVGMVYDYFRERHGWSGMDGLNNRVFSIVNIKRFDNAAFAPSPFGPELTGVLMFGERVIDGSPNRPWVALDVVAHEFMHGVTWAALTRRTRSPLFGPATRTLGPSSIRVGDEGARCGDMYKFTDFQGNRHEWPILCEDGRLVLMLDDSGAINEAYSDMMAMAVEFSVHPPGSGPLRADYLLGEDMGEPQRRADAPRSQNIGPLTYPDSLGQSFRFVVAQLADGFPVHFTRFAMAGDKPFVIPPGAVNPGYTASHWNSTILSHAYYLAIEGGMHSTGTMIRGVGGPNRALVERAFFRALVELAPPDASMSVMGATIRQAAMDLHGAGSAAHAAIDQALTAVGL